MPLQTFTDEHIEHWGQVFVDNHFYDKGLQFSDFLLKPEQTLEAMAFSLPMPIDDEFYPLLPRQVAVQKELEQKEQDKQLEEDLSDQFERAGHIVEIHGNRNSESTKKRAPIKRWKTNTRRAG